MRKVDGMSDVLANAASDKPPSWTRLQFSAPRDLDVKEVQARARVDENGRSEEENRRQPRGRCAVQNGLAPSPSQRIDDCHHAEPRRDDYEKP